MADYPDDTTLNQIIGTDIMIPIDVQGAHIQMPIDVQGAYIQMPVDIQGQYITLEMDIVAQSIGHLSIDIAAQTVGNLNVNIAASVTTLNVNIASITGGVAFNVGTIAGTVNVNIASSAITLNVNISAQTIANLTISITAQTIGVYLAPDWNAVQGNDKNFVASALLQPWGGYAQILYTVTAGKKLYICGVSGSCTANADTESDKGQMCRGSLADATAAINLCQVGGNGGVSLVLSKPVVIPAGHVFTFVLFNRSNHYVDLFISAWGYEI